MSAPKVEWGFHSSFDYGHYSSSAWAKCLALGVKCHQGRLGPEGGLLPQLQGKTPFRETMDTFSRFSRVVNTGQGYCAVYRPTVYIFHRCWHIRITDAKLALRGGYYPNLPYMCTGRYVCVAFRPSSGIQAIRGYNQSASILPLWV